METKLPQEERQGRLKNSIAFVPAKGSESIITNLLHALFVICLSAEPGIINEQNKVMHGLWFMTH